MAPPPPLPPRLQSAQSASPTSPPHHEDGDLLMPASVGLGYSTKLHASDPRTSSAQSLRAPAEESDTRRSLLIIYIHGFYGNDQSFRSFPAHVHATLTELLSETHIVHSKIYPRYKTYRAIHVARDNFSVWLKPHESPTTDVILVGHSMGGLLASEVALMVEFILITTLWARANLCYQPNHDPYLHQPFKHRILGTLSLDSPFLGLHPGIVASGLSSLFQPAPKSDKGIGESASQSSLAENLSAGDLTLPVSNTASNASTISSLSAQTNEFYDPPFFNDVPHREKPLLSRLRHFAYKHKAQGIFNAIGNHIVSHLEFGGCMADYPELVARYKRIRALEDVDELKAISQGHPAAAHRRVRFVNYYTLSPGRPKPSPQIDAAVVVESSLSTLALNEPEAGSKELARSETDSASHSSNGAEEIPRLDLELADDGCDEEDLYEAKDPEPQAGEKSTAAKSSPESVSEEDPVSETESHKSLLHLDPVPMLDEMEETAEIAVPSSEAAITASPEPGPDLPELDLTAVPPAPEEPTYPDLTKYTDKDARKQAEKEAKREQKAYQQAVKNRNRALREREKLVEKRRKKSEKEAQKLEKQLHREMQRRRDEAKAEAETAACLTMEESVTAAVTTTTTTTMTDQDTQHQQPPKEQQPRKLRKFCALPGKINGRPDPTWVDVYMADVDEVGAHCGLFAPGAHYDTLVGDVGNRVMAWVHEDLSTRAAMAMQ
ncbi:catalytic protein [Beauveria brongniartii RCEF 3172]|uniref:Catalytic protein n=1 Tax=Beauveria brongniartii RCEF 3172 TaxID=1081107 RepID=A0A167E8L6_9HYPO|nr:catalytic protein [Beauveria brongniartii RCEF 3172]